MGGFDRRDFVRSLTRTRAGMRRAQTVHAEVTTRQASADPSRISVIQAAPPNAETLNTPGGPVFLWDAGGVFGWDSGAWR